MSDGGADQATANKETVTHLYDYINQQRYELLTEIIAPSYQSPINEQTGATAFEAVARMLHDGIADLHIAVEDLFGEGDRVAVRWTMTGRHVGPFFGEPPTGERVQQSANVIQRLEGGRIAQIWLQTSGLQKAEE